MPPSLSIVIPAYNEATRLKGTLNTILGYFDRQQSECELIVVDDGSTDDTLRVIEDHEARSSLVKSKTISVRPNHGKGNAVRVGLLAATAPIALFTDADLSTPITELSKLVEPIETGKYDVTFGSRALDRGLIGVHQPWRREQGGRVFNLFVRLATGLPFWDTQCGFKCFRMSVCRPIVEAMTIERFGFDVELLYVTYKAGLRLFEVPVRWDHNEGSKVSVVRDSLRMLNEVRTIRSQFSRGVYDDAIQTASSVALLELASSNDDNSASVDVEMTTDIAGASH